MNTLTINEASKEAELFLKQVKIIYDIDKAWKINPLDDTFLNEEKINAMKDRNMSFFRDKKTNVIGCVFQFVDFNQYLKYSYITETAIYAFYKCTKISEKEYKKIKYLSEEEVSPSAVKWFTCLGATFVGMVGYGYNTFYYDYPMGVFGDDDGDDDDSEFEEDY